jgi:hypothetical protein
MDRIICPQCGEEHDLSEMQIAFAKPDAWFAIPPQERDKRVRINQDLATIDAEHGFVRGVLEIPVRGEPKSFGWGIWVRVDRDVFDQHAYAGREGYPAVPAPASGHIATQLPGYPQTLGVPVIVQASFDTTQRPTFIVTDTSHPLGIEQASGIYVERALEHLHAGEIEPRGRPRFAALGSDGWELDDALSRYHHRDGVNWLPDSGIRAALQVGDAAKVIFAIEASSESGDPEVHRERMWVEVDHIAGTGAERLYSGALTNDPNVPGLARSGMRVWFQSQHVIDVARTDGWRASRDKSVLQCTHHGPSQTIFVCQHLPRGAGVGFNPATDPGNPRPNAWCDACDRMLVQERGWTDRAEAMAKIVVICASCYDIVEERNRTGSEPGTE